MLTHFYFLPVKRETLTAPFNGYGEEDVYMAYTGAHYMLLSAVNGSLSCADKSSPSVSGKISCFFFFHKELNWHSSRQVNSYLRLNFG